MINITRKFFTFCFLTVSITLVNMTGANAMTDKTNATAVELLTAFSGENATKYEQHFKYSDQAKIISVEIHAVGNESTTARYTDEELVWKEVNNILRITTADGYEAISGVDTYYQGEFSDHHFKELESVADDLMALQTLDPVEVHAILTQSHPDLSNEMRASIDIALWDLAARKAKLPLHKFLGSNRKEIASYASLPFYYTLPEYIDAVNEYAKLGYTVFKFHVWGSVEKETLLVKEVEKVFEDTLYKFMIDFESTYDLEDALKLGKMTDGDMFISYEALLDDTLLEQSAELKRELPMWIIPAGYNVYSPEYIREGIGKKSWDAGRFDITVAGGYSKALELMIIAEEGELTIDIQSWGHTLAQTANLHLMLANDRTEYFEAPMPKEAFEFGMINGNLLHEGKAVATKGHGLGIEVDWDLIATADFYRTSK
jgi:L-alanine-DL-glutamate epimerase-like enolase superfamily enzyme